ncbi:MAG: thioredoxin-disulfide reductase [Candidatus Hydrogenedentes bacterium]|nr:thioredoxin-disulfide reductase [Candidatus Hydrogenedentota bacterium]
MRDSYEVAIIGAGPAGLTAALYASRAGLSVGLFEKEFAGGQLMLTELIDNYPGVPTSTAAFELADQMKKQALEFGAEMVLREIVGIDGLNEDRPKTLRLKDGTVTAESVIVATGAHPRRIGIPGEDKFWGKGVSACGTCDGHFYKGRDIVVVGGGDTAVEEATFLSRLVRKITLVHRRDRLRAAYTLQQRLMAAGDMITFEWDSVPIEIVGDDTVTGVNIKNVKTGEERFVACDGVFIFIGYIPNTELVRDHIETDQTGYIVTDDHMATSAPGVFACGDVRQKLLRQIVTACGDGATAAFAAQRYVDARKGTLYE